MNTRIEQGIPLPHIETFRDFSEHEHQTWTALFNRLSPKRSEQIVTIFSDGIKTLEIDERSIPNLNRVNQLLKQKTGFIGVPVTGHEDPRSFFPMLKRREFPIGNFIRDKNDLNYTPAPDVFHDLYGHLPFLANPQYADFLEKFGEYGTKYIHQPELLRQYERLFWFTCEFALIKTDPSKKIFGAGIASSFGECAYALGENGQGPIVIPFDIEIIRVTEFRIDEMQKKVFMLKSLEELYQCLPRFDENVRS